MNSKFVEKGEMKQMGITGQLSPLRQDGPKSRSGPKRPNRQTLGQWVSLGRQANSAKKGHMNLTWLSRHVCPVRPFALVTNW